MHPSNVWVVFAVVAFVAGAFVPGCGLLVLAYLTKDA